MTPDDRAARIEEAAYKVLTEKGFKGASMLAVARAAKASNETLYNWYGDKVGLFSALVARNAAMVATRLDEARKAGNTPLGTLEQVGEVLLTMLTGPRSVALNRAAAADTTGELGRAVAKGGRETVAPMLVAVLTEAQAAGDLGPGPLDEMLEDFLGLLLSDMQIRRAIGVLDAPAPETITARTRRAVERLVRLYPA